MSIVHRLLAKSSIALENHPQALVAASSNASSFILSTNNPRHTSTTMANFLASIFGTELDKVNCSFYFVSNLCHATTTATTRILVARARLDAIARFLDTSVVLILYQDSSLTQSP